MKILLTLLLLMISSLTFAQSECLGRSKHFVFYYMEKTDWSLSRRTTKKLVYINEIKGTLTFFFLKDVPGSDYTCVKFKIKSKNGINRSRR